MDAFLQHWVLTAAVFIPAVGAAVLMLSPKAWSELWIKSVALFASLVAFAAGIYVIADFDYGRTDKLQFTTNRTWIDVIHSNYHIGVDGISLPLFALCLFIVPLCIIYSWDHFPEPHNPKAFLTLVLILEVGMTGTFVAEDWDPLESTCRHASLSIL